MGKKLAAGPGAFDVQFALAQEYGALVKGYLEHGTDTANGGAREGSWVEARDRAGVANVEAWWFRYYRAARARYASRVVLVGFLCYLAGLLSVAGLLALRH
jgi:hypothetical protein